MANSKYIGLIKCPLCGSESATVHEQQSGTKKGRTYYRCYTEINGAKQRCGTVQCIGPTGQEFIAKHMRPLSPAPAPIVQPTQSPEPPPVAAPEPIGQPEPEPEPIGQDEHEPVKKTSWRDAFFGEGDE